MRINKFLANASVCSRRNADLLIEQGKVTVNGAVAKVGQEINEAKDEVMVDGRRVQLVFNKTYLMLNKPKGYICSTHDEKSRKTVLDLINTEGKDRIYPVGRLDYDTEGILILTNDGELTERLTHPRNEVPKTYQARIEGDIQESAIAKLKSGVEIEPNVSVRAISLKIVETDKKFTKVEITICEGKNRQVRRMFEAVGKEVIFLKRIKIGDLKMHGLDRGKYRPLTREEIDYLKNI